MFSWFVALWLTSDLVFLLFSRFSRFSLFSRYLSLLETEQLAREAELRDEYDDLQKEIQSLGLINNDHSNMDGSADSNNALALGDEDTHHFLVDEKERMIRKKKQLELQMQSIILENKQNTEALEIAMDAKKVKAKSRLEERLARRRNKKNSVGGIMKLKRGKSKFKRLAGIGHNGERNIDGRHPSANSTQVVPIGELSSSSTSSTVMHMQDHHKRVQLEEATVGAKNNTLFKLLGYYKMGDSGVDQNIEKYILEHSGQGIDVPRDDSGSTLLIASARVGNCHATKLLLEHKANITCVNQDQATCLHYAAYDGNSEMVHVVLKHHHHHHKHHHNQQTLEAEKATRKVTEAEAYARFLNMVDIRGNTAASYAAIQGHTELAQKLGLTSTTPTATLTSEQPKSASLSKWRRAAWRSGIKKAHEKRSVAMNFKSIIAIARARKGLEDQLNDHGASSFDPAKQEEHNVVKQKLQEQVSFLELQLTQAKEDMSSGETKSNEIDKLKKELLEIRNNDQVLRGELEQEATERRRLHNTIEDMKGAIRVFCRIRPLSSSELARSCKDVTEYMSDKCSIKLHPGGKDECDDPLKIKRFTFDSVFSPVDDQSEVFRDVAHLVTSACDGYNVCIFAYGQTGSGKTYTMNGVSHSPGVQPRSINEIFNIVKRDGDKKDFKISSYMIEMYLGGLNDLYLNTKNGVVMGERDRQNKLKISKDTNGQVVVNGITHCTAQTAADLNALLESGMRKRKVASTEMNSESSRSHLISTIIIQATDRKTKLITTGKLTLVDLAGSESQKKTGAKGNQLKEAKAINSSLSALGAVISALTSKKDHVPYRNSKLTELLADGLGGNAKCLMFVNASPADYNINETAGSFEFALRCKKITNAKSGVSVETQEVRNLKEQLLKLQQLHEATNVTLPGIEEI